MELIESLVVYLTVGYTMDTLVLKPLAVSHAIEFDANVHLSNFRVTDIILYDCSQNYTSGLINHCASLFVTIFSSSIIIIM